MTHLPGRLPAVLAAPVVAVLIAACAGTATQPSPTPSPPVAVVVDTPEEAIAAVVAAEPRLTGIKPQMADLIGQSAWYSVTEASGVGAYVVEVVVGWGDCPAGCIEKHTWTYAVQPDGSVSVVSEAGGAVPPAAWPQPAGTGQTGIVGVAVAGPTCPVEALGDPACAPRAVADATVVVLDGGGTEVARTTTAADGSFFVAVPAGDYTVRGEAVEGLMGTPEPAAVSVSEGSSTQVQLGYDTGIR